MKNKSIFFSLLIAVLLKRSTTSSSRKVYIGSCQYYEAQVSNPVNDIVTLFCYDTDAPTNKVFPQQASVYLECANKRKANGYQAGNVHFQNNCQMSRIKYNISTVFTRFHTLNVSGIELQSLPSSFFTGAKFMKTLIASNNRLLEIPSHQFAQCPMLTDVDYSYNKINRIDGDAFGGVSSTMKKLNLSHNHLTELHPNFFPNLSKLEVIDLSYNSIEHLVPFANLSKLVHLNLSFNNIKDLPNAMILSQPNLQFLQLSHNNFTVLKMEKFAKQNSLHLLDLSYNSIKKLDFNATRMEHLEQFHINNNQLTDLDGFKNIQFPILNSFAISWNKFNCSYLTEFLNCFDYHSSLSVLHLPNSTHQIEGIENIGNGIGCYNVSSTSSPFLEDIPTIPDGKPFIRVTTTIPDGTLLTTTQATNILNDITTTKPVANVRTTTVSLYNMIKSTTHYLATDDAATSTGSHSIRHLMIVLCVLVALNVGVMIIMIIRNRKSTSPTNTTGYNCAYNPEIGIGFSSTAVENQYETVLIGGKRSDNSDIISVG